jgi:hypothetical protein
MKLQELEQTISDFLNEQNLRAVEEGEMKNLMSKTLALTIYNRWKE